MSKARRGKGEGSIYRRRDGRWVAELDLGYRDGKRRRRTLYGRNYEEVRAKLRKAHADQDHGLPLGDSRQTVREFFIRWLEAVRPSLSQRTWERYEQYTRLHVVPGLGDFKVSSLSGQHLERFYADRLATLNPTTVHHIHALIHRAFASAVRQRLLAFNVANEVDPPRIKRSEFAALTAEQARRLLRAARGHRLEALFTLALSTGMRQGEMLALSWRDIDLAHRRVTVRGTLQRIGGKGLLVGEPKTRSSRRRVALGATAVKALTDHYQRECTAASDRGAGFREDDFVFTNERGGPLDPGNLRDRVFRPLLAQAGLPMIRFHDLRHSAATLLLGEGLHAKIVSEMLGHANITMTLDTYSHVTPTMHDQAANVIDQVFAMGDLELPTSPDEKQPPDDDGPPSDALQR